MLAKFNILGKTIFGETFAYSISLGISRFGTILLLPVLTRNFSVQEYGAIDLLQVTMVLMNLVVLWGSDSAVGRFVAAAASKEEGRTYASQAAVTVVFFSIAMI